MKKVILTYTALALSSTMYAALQPSNQEKRHEYLQQPHIVLRQGRFRPGVWGLTGSIEPWYCRPMQEGEKADYLQDTQEAHTHYFVEQSQRLHAAEQDIFIKNLPKKAWCAWTVRGPALLYGAAAGFLTYTRALSGRTKAMRIGGAIGAAASAGCLTAWLCHKLVCYKNDIFKQDKDITTMAEEMKNRWTLFRQNPHLLPGTASLDLNDPFQPDAIRLAVREKFAALNKNYLHDCPRTEDLLKHLAIDPDFI